MKELNKIQQELKAPKNQRNNFGNYNYRSAEDILEAVKPLLGEATLTISDDIIVLGDNNPQQVSYQDSKGNTTLEVIGEQRFYVRAIATLTVGEKSISVSAFARETNNKKGMDSSQITGSASSYARKYALNGLFAIDDTKDSDHSQGRSPEQQQDDYFSGNKAPKDITEVF